MRALLFFAFLAAPAAAQENEWVDWRQAGIEVPVAPSAAPTGDLGATLTAALGWPNLLSRPVALAMVSRGAHFGGPALATLPAAVRGLALRVESQKPPGYGWGALLGAELSIGDGASVPLMYGAAYRDRFGSVDLELAAQALVEVAGALGTHARFALNWGLSSEVRARWEFLRGAALWASLGTRAVMPGPIYGAADAPAVAGTFALGLSLDPAFR
jgi:hypothetical protein